jgi:hypothetical protein
MILTEAGLIQILITIGAFVFAFTVLKIWYILSKDQSLKEKIEEIERTVKGNKIALSKHRGYFKQISEGNPATNPQNKPSIGIDLSGMTLDQAAKEFEFDIKALNNPIFRPTAEKIWDQIKKKLSQRQEGEESEFMGY